MTVKKRKKNVRMRGSKTHGYGAKKKHRGKGSRGGRGYAGSHKHKYSYITAKEPEHFGYKGFVSKKKKSRIINIRDLEKMEGDVDLNKMGFTKLLSEGKVSKPLIVKVRKYSKKAKEKIEKAGGKIVE